MITFIRGVGLVALAAFGFSGVARSATIDCNDPAKNYMTMSDTLVTGCVAAGVGNIGNGKNDDFLFGTGGGDAMGYVHVGEGTFDADARTFSFNASLWANGPLAIGFKFGTGNTADEWFIYNLVANVTSGSYTFTCTLCKGQGNANGGLSHIEIYSYGDDDDTDVPEPGSLALLGLGLLGLGMSRRRKI